MTQYCNTNSTVSSLVADSKSSYTYRATYTYYLRQPKCWRHKSWTLNINVYSSDKPSHRRWSRSFSESPPSSVSRSSGRRRCQWWLRRWGWGRWWWPWRRRASRISLWRQTAAPEWKGHGYGNSEVTTGHYSICLTADLGIKGGFFEATAEDNADAHKMQLSEFWCTHHTCC